MIPTVYFTSAPKVHQLALCFYENECQAENLIEYHIFEYSYNANGVSLSINSKSRSSEQRSLQISLESVKKRTIMLIRMLYVYMTQNGLQELPLNYDVSLRLYYNDGKFRKIIVYGRTSRYAWLSMQAQELKMKKRKLYLLNYNCLLWRLMWSLLIESSWCVFRIIVSLNSSRAFQKEMKRFLCKNK